MNDETKALVAAACLASGLVGYLIGQHGAEPAPPLVQERPRPLVRLTAAQRRALAVVDGGEVPDAGVPEVAVRVPLTEPRAGEGLLDFPKLPNRPPLYLDGGHDRTGEHREEASRRAAAEAPPPAAKASLADPSHQLEEMAAQLRELQTQLAEAKQSQQARDADAAQHLAETREALGALQRADSALALGSTDIDGELAQAAASLTGQAAAEIEGARQSLANSDLFSARQHVQRALVLGAKNGVEAPVVP